jgi:uncharacterized protein YhbP (UPF0306 family)
MDVKQLVKGYLDQTHTLQLATSENDQPWVCTLHFYADDGLNIYWISTEARHHSQQIKNNHNAAATILVHENTPQEDYVIGITMAGQAEYIGERVEDHIGQAFLEKHRKDPGLLTDISNGKNPHKFYRLTPSKIILFDTKNFPDNPRTEIEF